MCGILGAVPLVEPGAFRRSLTRIAHRGPDGSDVWQDAEHAILGHRRLAILDVSDLARQPMHYVDRFHLVFNGEIYNFLEIRRELEALGHRFKTISDSEVLLAAFAEWGSDSVTRLNGMWAFAIWDAREKQLFLSRDRMGKKPLFYSHNDGRFVFASEQKALLPFLRRVQPSPRFHALVADAYTYEATESSLFDGISRFPAAHNGWLTGGHLRLTRYWTPKQGRVPVPATYPEQVEALRDLLIDSCRIRMRADVPIGTGLSGGIDSSAVASGLAEVGRRPSVDRLPADWQNAFVASFPGTVMDETAHARRVADHVGIRLIELPIDPGRSVECIEGWAYLFEEVHEVNPAPHILLYKAMRDHGVVVTLDGHGGDELFCGYESSILHALPDAAMSPASFQMVLDTYRSCHPRNAQFRGLTLPRIAAYLAKGKLRRIASRTRDVFHDRDVGSLGSLNSHLLDLSFRTVLPTLLRNYDRYAMINGVEIRMPLLDHRIVDFAFALPWTSKVRNGFTKAILRDAAAPFLPAGIVERKEKIGFAPPIWDWMRGPLRPYLMDEISSTSFGHAQLIQPARLSAEITALISGTRPVTLYEAERTWKQFAVYLWEKTFIQKRMWNDRN